MKTDELKNMVIIKMIKKIDIEKPIMKIEFLKKKEIT
jgi:hypothetical protein